MFSILRKFYHGTTSPRSIETSAWPPETLGAYKQEFLQSITPLMHACNDPNVSIAFGGHFNSGKSTLLAALIDRDILPIGDLPETGVACRLRTGSADQVRRIGRSGETAAIPFDRNAISDVSAAYTHLGDRRHISEMPESLEIMVAEAPIPPKAAWIDSPGINDTADMTDRALQIAIDADLLVWVLNSRQCLSRPEIDFLAKFVAKRGAEALALVLNVFLDEDSTEAWNRFSARELPILIGRIRDHAEEFGMNAEDVDVHVVSARAMRANLPGEFRGGELRKWLSSITDPNMPVIRRSRIRRTDIASAGYQRALEPSIEQARAEVSRAEREIAAHRSLIKRRDAFRTDARDSVNDAISRFSKDMEAQVKTLCDSLVSGSLDRGTKYEDDLNSALRNAYQGDDLFDRLSILLGKYELGHFKSGAHSVVSDAFTTQDISISVRDTKMNVGTIGGAAIAAGIVATPFTGGLSLLAVGAGVLGGAALAQSKKNKKDLELTVSSIRMAILVEVRRVRRNAESLVQTIEDDYLGLLSATPSAPDHNKLRALEAMSKEYGSLPTRIPQDSQ